MEWGVYKIESQQKEKLIIRERRWGDNTYSIVRFSTQKKTSMGENTSFG